MVFPSSVILVRRRDFPFLDQLAGSLDMDVVEVEIYGWLGYGFFIEDEAERVLEVIINIGFDFKFLKETEFADHYPPAPNMDALGLWEPCKIWKESLKRPSYRKIASHLAILPLGCS